MAALKTEQLECLLDCVIPNTTRPLGVFPANCIPLRRDASNGVLSLRTNIANAVERHPHLDLGHNYCFILNTHPNNAPGEHWLAFLFNSNTRKLEYFDSFGLPISVYENVHVAMSSCDLLPICMCVNTLGMIQSTTSTVCGHFCIAELYWRSKHIDAPADKFAHVAMSTSTSPDVRDKFIVDRLRTITSKHPCCSSQLFGTPANSHGVTRFSQSCCCRDSCCTHSPI
jgi:Adenovirus endoprotease